MTSLYVKLGGAAALLAAIFGLGWHLGGLSGQAALARLQRDQAQNIATAVLNERDSTQAEVNRLRAVVTKYENAPPDPVVPGIAGRLYKYTLASRTMSCPATVAPGASPAGAVSAGDPELERLSQAAFDAAGQDARKLTAIQEAWSAKSDTR